MRSRAFPAWRRNKRRVVNQIVRSTEAPNVFSCQLPAIREYPERVDKLYW